MLYDYEIDMHDDNQSKDRDHCAGDDRSVVRMLQETGMMAEG